MTQIDWLLPTLVSVAMVVACGERMTSHIGAILAQLADDQKFIIENGGSQLQTRVVLVHPDAKLPAYAHEGDSGADLASVVNHYIPAGGWLKIPLGVAIQLSPGFEAQVRPRSSLSANGIVCAFGTIDQGYTGELSAVLYNLTPHEYEVKAGQRVCQLVIAPVARVTFVEAESLDATERGDNGWGSSGT